jgi:Fe-S cluster assembly protein NifU
MNWVYSEKVREHFQNPKNILWDENEYQADGMGEIGNAVCGDMMMMMIKVDENKIITDCKWKTYGCASAIASTSMLSEMVKGLSLEEAYKIKPRHIMKELDGLPNNKIHCSVLGDKALRKAIDDYYKKHGVEIEEETESKVVCTCMNITENDIKHAVFEKKIEHFSELQEHTKIATSCGGCEKDARALLEEFVLMKEEEEHE